VTFQIGHFELNLFSIGFQPIEKLTHP